MTSSASALSKEQKRVMQSGSDYFNVEETVRCTLGGGPAAAGAGGGGALTTGSKIYMVGDSISVLAKTALTTAFTGAGYEITKINADGGRAILTDTGPPGTSGLTAVADDATFIASSDAVIVELGTNSGNEDLNVQIPALITAIRAAKVGVPIYWVNLFYTSKGGPSARNATIDAQAAAQANVTVINMTTSNIQLESDGTHPTVPTGTTVFADFITNSLKAGMPSVAPGLGGSTFDPIGLTYPTFPNEQTPATAITDYIRTKYPASPWLGIDTSIGQWLLRNAKERNINPMLIMAIGKQENGFGTIGSATGHVKKYFNYFGIKGSSPINIPESDYAGFSSPSEGITWFMDTVKRNTQGADRGQYATVVNFYDYLGMHQSGVIAYPGDPLDPGDRSGPGGKPDGNTQDGWDNSMKVYTSWDPHKNDGPPTAPEYRGNVYNPGIYYTNSINMINQVLITNLPTTPTRGATSGTQASTCSTGSTSGAISTNGYAFPLAPQRKMGYGTLPCDKATCHHDGTPAYDLSYSDVTGKAVYAIIGGTIQKVGVQEAGWCQSIQLHGSDGYYYWYGHLIDVLVADDQTVTAGQKIASVATWTSAHTCNGTSGAAHLHIDRGCTIEGVRQPGGGDDCRDPEFIPFLRALWETLPE